MENLTYKYFLIIIGTTQTIIALIEFISPSRFFLIWREWILNRFFPVHGLTLILIGFPLTLYKGYLSSLIFLIGLFMALTGPVVLVYPEKIRKVFDDSSYSFKEKDIKIIMYLDAALRICTGLIFFISCWKTYFD